jgi:hypothetical protein
MRPVIAGGIAGAVLYSLVFYVLAAFLQRVGTSGGGGATQIGASVMYAVALTVGGTIGCVVGLVALTGRALLIRLASMALFVVPSVVDLLRAVLWDNSPGVEGSGMLYGAIVHAALVLVAALVVSELVIRAVPGKT